MDEMEAAAQTLARSRRGPSVSSQEGGGRASRPLRRREASLAWLPTQSGKATALPSRWGSCGCIIVVTLGSPTDKRAALERVPAQGRRPSQHPQGCTAEGEPASPGGSHGSFHVYAETRPRTQCWGHWPGHVPGLPSPCSVAGAQDPYGLQSPGRLPRAHAPPQPLDLRGSSCCCSPWGPLVAGILMLLGNPGSWVEHTGTRSPDVEQTPGSGTHRSRAFALHPAF